MFENEMQLDLAHNCDDRDYCGNCGHYHLNRPAVECPERNEPCGDYRCCVN